MKSLMEDIESGMYDDIIDEEIAAGEDKVCGAGTAEYMQWVLDTLSGAKDGVVFDDDMEHGYDAEKLNSLQSLYSFLVNKFALIPECEDDGVFCKSVIYFSYKGATLKMIQSFCEQDIITGIARTTDKKEYEELVL